MLVRTASGRFEGSTEEDVVEMMKELEEKIKALRKYIGDDNGNTQFERLSNKTREEAAFVDDEVRRQYEWRKQKNRQRGGWM